MTAKFSDGFTARSACAYIAMLQESGTVKVTGTLTEDDLTALENAIDGAADGVLVSLDLSGATASLTYFTYFRGCDKLRSIAFPRKVPRVYIGGCDALESVIIPNGVTEIYVGSRCISLTSLTIPASVTKIYASGPALESVTFKATSGWKVSRTGSTTTALSSADLADPKIAARYLRTTYLDYWWTRSE